jgi:succinoglycan biosynthesis protein ExoL
VKNETSTKTRKCRVGSRLDVPLHIARIDIRIFSRFISFGTDELPRCFEWLLPRYSSSGCSEPECLADRRMTTTTKRRIAYFGPDSDDPAVRRRVAQWRHAGFEVLAFAFSRLPVPSASGDRCIDLGRVSHQSRLARAVAMIRACARIFKSRRQLRGTQIFVARNIDNLLLALLARRLSAGSAPLVYEVLDINVSCTADHWLASGLRKLEKWALAHIDLLVVSSPHFIASYYHERLGYRGRWFLFENKVPRYARLARSAARDAGDAMAGPPWRIGWFGYLDDERSWNTLKAAAQALPDKIEIYVRGLPYTNFDMARFLADVAELPNVTYGGGFANPDDLAEIYGSVHLVWSIDCNDLQANSKWLLTNSVYEAGFLQKPVVALRDTAVGDFVTAFGFGWCLGDPLAQDLIRFVAGLSTADYAEKVTHISELTAQLFCETNEIEEVWSLIEPKAGGTSLPLSAYPAT